CLDQALQIFQKLSGPNERTITPGEAVTLNNIGIVYNLLEEKQKALEYYNKALSIFRNLSDHRMEARTLYNIGMVYDSLGEKQKGLDNYFQALPNSQIVRDRTNEAAILYGIARIKRSRGELTEARNDINKTLDIIESIRSEVISRELRASYFAKVQKYY